MQIAGFTWVSRTHCVKTTSLRKLSTPWSWTRSRWCWVGLTMITFYPRDHSSTLGIFTVQNIWLTTSRLSSTTQHWSRVTSSGDHSTTYTGTLRSGGLSQQVYLFASYESVPDNCELCDLLSSGQLKERKTYEDMFDWLIRKAECVYTSPSWSADQYLHMWRDKNKK